MECNSEDAMRWLKNAAFLLFDSGFIVSHFCNVHNWEDAIGISVNQRARFCQVQNVKKLSQREILEFH